MNVAPLNDAESLRQQRNQTSTQRRNTLSTKEGVIVNSFVKDCADCKPNLNDTCDTLIISNNAELPKRLNDPAEASLKSPIKSLGPIATVAMGVMGAFTGITAYVSHNAKVLTSIRPEERVSDFTRNLAINDEARQAVVRMVISPNKKTMLAGAGILVLTAMAFMGKTFSEGFRDVWIKKREADIQKNMQERLIAIETQSFGGKIQIIRSMLADRVKELNGYLEGTPAPSFGKGEKERDGKPEKTATADIPVILMGLGVIAAIVGLGFLSLKNLTKGKNHFEEYTKQTMDLIEKIVKDKKMDKTEAKAALDGLFQTVSASPKYIEEVLAKTSWNETERTTFAASVITKMKAPTTKATDALGGSGVIKTSIYSHVDDYRAFCYNWLLNTENQQFKQMFFGVTGLSALGYGGKLTGMAVRDIEVKKMNADTEVNLQNRLVATELRNFKAKKDAAITPLMNEFYRQAALNKPKEELKTIADNILFEIKNGPPFVYS